MSYRSLSIVAIAGLATSAHAQATFEWVGGAGQDWTAAANWDPMGAPGILDTAVFDIDATVGNGEAMSIVVGLDAEVVFGGANGTTTLASSLVNTGIVTFIGDSLNNISGVIDRRLLVPAGAAVTMSGVGMLVLNGSETGVQGGDGVASTLTNALNHRVTGRGTFQDLTFVNEGLIDVTGAILFDRVPMLDNTSGLIVVSESGDLELGIAELFGGVVDVVEGGQIVAASTAQTVIRDITLTGDVMLARSSGESFTMTGVIDNDAEVIFASDNLNNISSRVDIRVFVEPSDTLTLAGIGSVRLNGTETGFEGGDGASVLTNSSGHEILGYGAIATLNVSNEGVISIEGGDLDLRSTFLVNSGSVEVGADGAIHFDDSTLTGGVLRGVEGGLLDDGSRTAGGLLTNLTIEGALVMGRTSTTSLTVAGTITNNGTFTFTADNLNNIGGELDTRLFIDGGGSVTFAGTGSLVLNGTQTGLEAPAEDPGALVNGATHTIGGYGVLNNLSVTNEGLFSVDGGDLLLGAVAFDNASGVIELSPNAELALDRTTIEGGVIRGMEGVASRGGAPIRSVIDDDGNESPAGGFRDVAFEGEFEFGATSETDLSIGGMIENDAVIFFFADNLNNRPERIDTRLFVAAGDPVTFSGTGSIVLNGTSTGIEGEDETASLVNGADHTIGGHGELRTLDIDNDGLFLALGGEMYLNGVDMDNSSGVMRIIDDAELFFERTTVSGGTIEGIGEATLDAPVEDGATLVGVTLEGVLLIDGGSTDLLVVGELANNAEVVFERDTLRNRFDGVDSRFAVNAGEVATISGSGSMLTDGIATGFEGEVEEGVDRARLVSGASHTIAGSGAFVNLELTNEGTLRPGDDDGTEELTFTASPITMAAGSTYRVYTAENTSGVLESDGEVSLGGTLDLVRAEGYEPTEPVSFEIMTSSSGGITGRFDAVAGDPPAPYVVRYVVSPTAVTAAFTCVADFGLPFGQLDIADVVTFLQLFGAGDATVDIAAPFGQFDIADVVTFLQQFGAGCS